jgi:membrane-bound ClpP family serine protease
MGIGVSVFLIAVGAILAFAVEVTTEGVNLDTVGVILMIVGAIGLLMSMLFWSSWAPFAGNRNETYVREERY